MDKENSRMVIQNYQVHTQKCNRGIIVDVGCQKIIFLDDELETMAQFMSNLCTMSERSLREKWETSKGYIGDCEVEVPPPVSNRQ